VGMAKFEQHIAQWKHNRAFARSIDRKYVDWQVTVIFYTALHAIDAALAKLQLSVANHEERNRQVETNESFANVRKQYMNLYRLSMTTRYIADPESWLPEKYLTVNDLIDDLLKPIENGLTATVKSLVFTPLAVET
jgi:hypothetical protein